MPQCVGFIVRHVHCLLAQQKTLKGLRDLLNKETGLWKKVSVMDAAPKEGSRTAKNAKCLLVRLNGVSIFVVNARNIHAMT